MKINKPIRIYIWRQNIAFYLISIYVDKIIDKKDKNTYKQ